MNGATILRISLLVAVTAFGFSPVSAGTIWSIGREDGSHYEFALYREFKPYLQSFPNDVHFQIGTSAADKDWSGIQPGSIEDWAGTKPHPFTISFDLPRVNRTGYMLQLRLVSVHHPGRGQMTITVNGSPSTLRLPDAGNPEAWRDESLGKPFHFDLPISAKALRRGENQITFENDGYWILWDSVALIEFDVKNSPVVDPKSIQVKVDPFFMQRGDRLVQPAHLSLTLSRPLGDAELVVQCGGRESRQSIRSEEFGTVRFDIEIPEITEEGSATFSIEEGKKTLVTKTVAVKPARKWTVYIVPQAHVDIGYTDLQEKAMDVHRQSNDLAIKLAEQHENFVWSVESSYVLEDWLKTRPKDLIQRFFKLTQERKIEIEVLYGNLLTGLLCDEEEFRSLYFSKKLANEYGSSFASATLTDAPSHIWSIPTVLRKSGVKYLSMGINSYRGVILRGGLEERSPIWWEGPDGSRVLSFFHDHYAGAGRYGLTDAWPGQYKAEVGLDAAEAKIPGLLNHYDRPDYPFNSIHVHGAYGDNRPLTEDLPKNVEAWNKKYVYPKIVFSTNEEWFSSIEKEYGGQLKSVQGDGGAYWEDGAGSSALETAISRQCQQKALMAEMVLTGLHAQGGITQDYRETFAAIWHNIMLYNEHTWGAHNSITQPDLPEVKEQFRYKAQFAYRAQELLEPLMKEVASRLPRDSKGRSAKLDFDGTTLNTSHYTVTLDTQQGAISSIVDRDTGKELVDPKAPYRLGQVVYAENEEPPYRFSTPTVRSIYPADGGILIRLEHPWMPQINVTVRADRTSKRLDFEYDIEKVMTYQKEGVYVAFPFAGTNPAIDYAVANAVVRAGEDWLPGACKDWFTVQNWARVRTGDQDILWTSYDAPLVSLQDINPNKWLKELPITNGHIFGYILNNYWTTNYKAGQGGGLRFRFALTSAKEISNAEAVTWSRDWPDSARQLVDRMIRVEPKNVVVSGFKRAEDGMGYIVRLRETSGESVTAELKVPALKTLKAAHQATGVEVVEAALPVQNGSISVRLKPWDVVTVKVE